MIKFKSVMLLFLEMFEVLGVLGVQIIFFHSFLFGFESCYRFCSLICRFIFKDMDVFSESYEKSNPKR